MKYSFIVQIDADVFEQPPFDAQPIAERLLDAAADEVRRQGICLMDVEVNYLGSN